MVSHPCDEFFRKIIILFNAIQFNLKFHQILFFPELCVARRVDWEESKSKGDQSLNLTKLIQSNEVNHSTLNRSRKLEDQEIIEERHNILIIYSVIMVVGTFFYVYRSFSFFSLCLRISINMHDMIFRGITRARMIFFNNNPSGRILNRFVQCTYKIFNTKGLILILIFFFLASFARDIGSIDSTLPVVLLDVIDVSFTYSFILFICFVFCYCCYYCCRHCRHCRHC